MSLLIEHFIFFSFLHVFFLLLLIPPGDLILSRICSQMARPYRAIFSFGISILFWSLIVLLVALSPFDGIIRELILWGAFFFCFTFWCFSNFLEFYFRRDVLASGALIILYLFFISLLSAVPDGDFRKISNGQTGQILQLPVDNVIPYNFSRYIVSSITPREMGDIVPGWKAGDRGPIAGLMTAVVFEMLGLEERATWLDSTPGLPFVYQNFLSFLNILCVLPVFALVRKFADRSSGYLFLTLVFSNWFFTQNILFSWPKFLGAYFYLSALLGRECKMPPWLVGVFLSLGVLSHDSLLFAVLSFFMALMIIGILKRHTILNVLREAVPLLIGFATLQIPWTIAKFTVAPPSGRMFLMHAICSSSSEMDNQQSLFNLVQEYVQNNGMEKILSVRFHNLFFPFDLPDLFQVVPYADRDLGALFGTLGISSFTQFPWTIGPFLWIPAFCGFRRCRPLLFIGVCSFGAVIFLSILSGCERNTVNHHWAYPLILVLFSAASMASKSAKWPVLALIMFGISWNIFGNFVWLGVHSPLFPTLHMSAQMIFLQFAILGISLSILMFELIGNKSK